MHPETFTASAGGARICLAVDTECWRHAQTGALRRWIGHPRLACIRLTGGGADTDWRRAADFLKASVKERDISIIIESRIDLVAPLELDGVHLAGGPKRVRRARSELGPDLIVGAFCGATRHMGMQAGENGADYVSFGPVRQTDAAGVEIANPELFKWWNEFTVLPSMAEGGIRSGSWGPYAQLADFLLVGAAEPADKDPLR